MHPQDVERLAVAVLGQAYVDLEHVCDGIRRQMGACVCPYPTIRNYTSFTGVGRVFPLETEGEQWLLEFWTDKYGELSMYTILADIDNAVDVAKKEIDVCQEFQAKCLPCLIRRRNEIAS